MRSGPVRCAGATCVYPVLLGLGALDAAGYSLIGPVLPALAVTTGASPRTLGWLTASFPLTMLVGFLLAVRLLRTARARGGLRRSAGPAGGGCAGLRAQRRHRVLFAGRMVMGLGSGALWIAVTFRTLEYWPGQEYRCMSRVIAAYSVGALVGPIARRAPGLAPAVRRVRRLVLAASRSRCRSRRRRRLPTGRTGRRCGCAGSGSRRSR